MLFSIVDVERELVWRTINNIIIQENRDGGVGYCVRLVFVVQFPDTDHSVPYRNVNIEILKQHIHTVVIYNYIYLPLNNIIVRADESRHSGTGVVGFYKSSSEFAIRQT